MYPYIVNHYKKPKKEAVKEKGLATDCLIERETDSISKIWKGDISESVKILDKIIPKIQKYKRGGIAGTEYNMSSFIIPMITPEAIAKDLSTNTSEPTLDELLQNLLSDGFHMVFEEIYNMIKTDLEERKEYEKLYGVLKTEPLKNQLRTLQFIATFLKNAETAQNNGDYKLLFNCNLNLALKFSEQRNSLAERFFEHCLKIVSMYPCDSDGSSLALTRLHLGLYTITNGNYEKAYNDLNYVYEYSKGQTMVPYLEDGKSIFYHATFNLVHVCLNLAQSRLGTKQVREAGQYFYKAHKFATENKEDSLIIESTRHLGNYFAYKKDFTKALQTLTECLDKCERINDKKGIAVLCQSIGAVYFMLDDLNKAKDYYQRFVEVSDEGQDKRVLTESYLKTGYAFNNAGHYTVAVQYSREAFKLIMENAYLKQYEQEARCLYGVARAHSLYSRYIPLLYTKDPENVDKLLFWKNMRINSFVGPVRTDEMPARSESILKKRLRSLDARKNSEELVVFMSKIHRLYDNEQDPQSNYNLDIEKTIKESEVEEQLDEDEDEEEEEEDDDEEEEGEEEEGNDENGGEEEEEKEVMGDANEIGAWARETTEEETEVKSDLEIEDELELPLPSKSSVMSGLEINDEENTLRAMNSFEN